MFDEKMIFYRQYLYHEYSPEELKAKGFMPQHTTLSELNAWEDSICHERAIAARITTCRIKAFCNLKEDALRIEFSQIPGENIFYLRFENCMVKDWARKIFEQHRFTTDTTAIYEELTIKAKPSDLDQFLLLRNIS